MSEEDNASGDAARAFLTHLDQTGFFQQIKTLEENLKTISEDIKTLGDTATQRLDETESLAAHVLAIEAILAVLIKNNPIGTDELNAAIKEKTSSLSENAASNSAVRNIAETISTGKKL